MPCARSWLAATLTGALLLGCGETPSAPEDQSGPSFRAQHFTLLSGIFLGGDPSNPLVVSAGGSGATPKDICEGRGIPEAPGKAVLTPSGGFNSHTFGRSVHIDVFAFGGGSEDPCEFADAPLVASGTGKMTFNVEAKPSGAAIIHATVQGIVDLVAGGRARLFASARVNIRPDGRLLFDDEVVRLTPI